MIVDCHAHVVLAETFGAAGLLGPELTDRGFRVGDYLLEGVRYRGTPFMDVEMRLAAMDAAGISRQVLSPNPLCWFHRAPVEQAVAYCRVHNDALATLLGDHGAGRLAGLAQLPAQSPPEAVRELRRAVDLGLCGGAMGTDVGRPLDDLDLDVVWDAAVALDVPLALHPSTPGADGDPDSRLGRLGLDLHTGFAVGETVAVAELVLGGVLDRHPGLDVLVSHGGGASALLVARWRHSAATRPSGTGDPEHVDRALRRLWFDNHMGSAGAVAALVAEVGTDRIVLGTNFAGWDDVGPEPFGIDGDALGANAVRLFRLQPLRSAP